MSTIKAQAEGMRAMAEDPEMSPEAKAVLDAAAKDLERQAEGEDSNFYAWADQEIRAAGLDDIDGDYYGEIGDQLRAMIREFCTYGHSGGSAELTREAMALLLRWTPLTPLTEDPAEWMQVEGASTAFPGFPSTWQSRRDSSCFSTDGGRTYYDIDEPVSWWRRHVLRRLYRLTGQHHWAHVKHHRTQTEARDLLDD